MGDRINYEYSMQKRESRNLGVQGRRFEINEGPVRISK